jgi:hypothetical protein
MMVGKGQATCIMVRTGTRGGVERCSEHGLICH